MNRDPVDDLFSNLSRDEDRQPYFELLLIAELTDGFLESFNLWGENHPYAYGTSRIDCDVIPLDVLEERLKNAVETIFRPQHQSAPARLYKGIDYFYTRGIIPVFIGGCNPRENDEGELNTPFGEFKDCIIRSTNRWVLEVICEYSRHITSKRLLIDEENEM